MRSTALDVVAIVMVIAALAVIVLLPASAAIFAICACLMLTGGVMICGGCVGEVGEGDGVVKGKE
jgi:hypothetical protein